MRIENWHSKEIFKEYEDTAMDNANAVMDTVVDQAKALCPVDPITVREGKFGSANVSFIPKTGKNKGQLVQFHTEKRWMGRQPGDLKGTIRRVNKRDESHGSIRVYAGNFKIYWAFMVEHGTASTGWGGPARKQPFLRPPFHAIKENAVSKIKGGV
jgi:hypothetical protein